MQDHLTFRFFKVRNVVDTKALTTLIFLALTGFRVLALPGGSLLPEARPADHLHKSHFIPVDQGLAQLNLPPQTRNAIAVVKDRWGRCSGAYISDQGHILLASHCLEGCYEQYLSSAHLEEFEYGSKCSATVNGVEVDARVVAMLKCPASHNLRVRSNHGLQWVSTLPCSAADGDLAVILPRHPPPPDFRCLPLRKGLPKDNEAVFTIGRPARSWRQGTPLNSNGTDLFLSSGKVVTQPFCMSSGYKNTWIDLIFFGTASVDPGPKVFSKEVMEAVFSPRLIQTTVDALPGSSGGPLINWAGEVVGVASFMMRDLADDHVECKGATFFDSVSALDAMAEEWGSGDEIANLTCQKQRVPFTAPVQVSSQ